MKIHILVPHERPHFDEIVAEYELREYGETVYPGCRGARRQYLGSSPSREAVATFENAGALFLGIGGGKFDEHPTQDRPRVQNECCATLVAKKLKINELDSLIPLLREVKECDLKGNVRSTRLASLVKLRHRRNPTSPDMVVEWAMEAVRTIHQALSKGFRWQRSVALKDLASKIVSKRSPAPSRALDRFRTEIGQSVGHSSIHLTELATIVEAFRFHFKSDSELLLWLEPVVLEFYDEQVEFEGAVSEFHDNAKIGEFIGLVGGVKTQHQYAVIESDSELIQKAARTTRTGLNTVLAVRQSRGNTQIFVDAHSGLNVANLARMLRWLELTKEGRKCSMEDWDSLGCPGDHQHVRAWHYFKPGESLFNGSLSHPDVSPTKLSLPEIADAIESAFEPSRVKSWQMKNGVIPLEAPAAGESPRLQSLAQIFDRALKR